MRMRPHVLRLAGDDKPRDVRSRALPLPDDGELVFTLWARADAAAKLTMHVVQDGWGKRVEKRVQVIVDDKGNKTVIEDDGLPPPAPPAPPKGG